MRDILYLDELFIRLNSIFGGITYFPSSLPLQYKLDNNWLNPNEYCLRYNSEIKNLLHGKLLVGSLNRLIQILFVVLSFHDIDDNIIQDDFGQPLQYTSVPQDFGHLLEFSPIRFDYNYAKFIFKLLSDENFDPNSIFFHFAHPTQSTSTSLTTTTKPGKQEEHHYYIPMFF